MIPPLLKTSHKSSRTRTHIHLDMCSLAVAVWKYREAMYINHIGKHCTRAMHGLRATDQTYTHTQSHNHTHTQLEQIQSVSEQLYYVMCYVR